MRFIGSGDAHYMLSGSWDRSVVSYIGASAAAEGVSGTQCERRCALLALAADGQMEGHLSGAEHMLPFRIFSFESYTPTSLYLVYNLTRSACR